MDCFQRLHFFNRDKSLVCTVVMLMAATLLLTVKKVTYVVIYHGEQFGLVKICTVTVSYLLNTPHLVV